MAPDRAPTRAVDNTPGAVPDGADPAPPTEEVTVHRPIRRLAVVTTTALLVTGLAAAPAAATPPTSSGVTVVASGLDNPRGLTYRDGHVYMALAGTGGTDCPKGVTGPDGGPLCVGLTGRIVDVSARSGHVRSVRNNLISFSDIPGGLAAEGPMSVAFSRSGLEVVYGESVVGFTADIPSSSPLTPTDDAAVRANLGSLQVLGRHGDRYLADVGDADYSWAAVHKALVPTQFPDANPNAIITVGRTTYVADAGANTIVAVRGNHVQQLAFLPNPATSDAVPTCVAMGPDHALYVGQLSPGAPANGSNIYRYDLRRHTLRVWKTGLNVVDGCGFDRWGNFFAVEFQAHGFNPGPTGNPAGDVVEFARDGSRHVLGAGQLFYPQGFATDNRGHLYLSNWSILTGTPAKTGAPTGQLVRLSYSH